MYSRYVYTVFYSVLGVLLMPLVSFAMTVHYTCSDFPSGSGSCTADVVSIGATDVTYNASGLQWPNSTDVFVSFAYSGSGTGTSWFSGDVADSSHIGFTGTGSIIDQPLMTGAGNTNISLAFYGNGSFVGSISNICVTDVSGDCEAAPPAAGFTTTPGLISIQDASTTLITAGGYATPVFSDLIILAASLTGLAVGGLLVMKFFEVLSNSMAVALTLKKSTGVDFRRRRRR